MTAIYRWLVANEIYWALRIADACEGWAHNARQRLRKLSGKLPDRRGLK